MVDDTRRIDVGVGDGTLCSHGDLDDHRETLLVFGEGGEVGGELLRQHREDAGGCVHGGRVDPGMRIDGGVCLHDGGDIRHGDENLHRTTVGGYRDRELVEI